MILEFYADWCSKCKMIEPILEELTRNNKIELKKINVDKERKLTKEYGVMSLPTIIYIKDGKEINKAIGLISREELEKWF